MNRARSTALWLLWVRLLGTMPRLAVQATIPQVMAWGGFGPKDAGLIVALHSVAAIATIYAYDGLRQRYSAHKITVAGGVLSAIGMLSVATIPGPEWLWLTFSLLGGCGWAMFSLRGPQELIDLRPPFERVSSLRAVAQGPVMAALLVPPLTLVLAEAFGWKAILVLYSLVIGASALLFSKVSSFQSRDSFRKRRIEPTGLRLSEWMVTSGAVLSGFVAGLLNAHLVLIVQSVQSGLTWLVAWVGLSGTLALVSTYIWAGLHQAKRITTSMTYSLAVAITVTAAAVLSSNGFLLLISSCVWPAVSIGLFMEIFLPGPSKAANSRRDGQLIILHLISGAAGAYLGGALAQTSGSYFAAFATTALLALVHLAIRMPSNKDKRSQLD